MTELMGVEDQAQTANPAAALGLRGLRGRLCQLDGAQGADWGVGIELADGTQVPLAAGTQLRVGPDVSAQGAAIAVWVGELIRAPRGRWAIRDEHGYWNPIGPLAGLVVELL